MGQMLGEGGARGRQRQWSQLWLRGGSSCLPAYCCCPPTTYYLFILTHCFNPTFTAPFFNCYFSSHYLLCLIALPQDLLYDYFFWRYRPLPVVTTPLNYQHRSRQYFIPETEALAPISSFDRCRAALLARAIISVQLGLDGFPIHVSYQFQSTFFLKCEV